MFQDTIRQSIRQPIGGKAGRRLGAVLVLAVTAGALAAASARAAAAPADPTILILADYEDAVKVVDAATGAVQHSITLGSPGPYSIVSSADGRFAYVPAPGSNNISVVDLTADTVASTIPVGTQPYGPALTPDGTQLWVPNYRDGTVSVVDTASARVVLTFTVGIDPTAIAFAPNGQTAYVPMLTNQVAVVRTADVAAAIAHGSSVPVSDIAVGNQPRGIAITPNGASMYVADYADGTVSVINTATAAVTATIPVGTQPYRVLAAAGNAQMLVENSGSASLSVISTATNTVTSTVAVGADPLGITLSQDGTHAYVANHNADTVSVVSIPGDTVVGTLSSVGNNPQDVAFVNTASSTPPPPANAPTTTTLSVSPGGSVTQGAATALTATVAPAAAGGSVTFYDGGQAIGGPTAVSGGTATSTLTATTAGRHTLSARFTPATTAYLGSASASVPYVVNVPGAAATTTALAVSPSNTAPQYAPVTFTATVSPATAPGTVQFADTRNGTTSPLGAPVTVASGGTATLTTTALAAGTHSVTAEFTPTDTTAFTISSSAAIAYTVSPPATGGTGEGITTTVVPGALVVSVADARTVLPSPVLNSSGTLLATAGPLTPITLTDTRAGNPGWTVTCQATDFADDAGHTINGANLGITPQVIDLSAAQTATAGAPVSPADAVEASDTGQAGLRGPHTLAVGGGLGTAHLGGGLTLNVPTDTPAGTYTATLIITAI